MDTDTFFENTYFYLLGFPGTGKLTIAKEIVAQEQMAATKAGHDPVIRLVDNHLINNPIFNIVKLDGSKLPEDVWDNIGRIWDVVFDTMLDMSPKTMSFVQTNALCNDDESDHVLFNKVARVTKARQARFVIVRLHCDLDVLKQRIQSHDRIANLKDTNPNSAVKFFNNHAVLKPNAHDYMDLDVTTLTPQQSAVQIRKFALNLK